MGNHISTRSIRRITGGWEVLYTNPSTGDCMSLRCFNDYSAALDFKRKGR